MSFPGETIDCPAKLYPEDGGNKTLLPLPIIASAMQQHLFGQVEPRRSRMPRAKTDWKNYQK
jgi:hypothetical protein